jgi:hypothetical protein
MTSKTIKIPKKIGRPTKYTPQLADEICDAIASSELGLAHLVAAHPHWPERQNIFLWIRKYPEFRDKYAKAKEDQTDVCVEYMQEVMNEPHKLEDPETGLYRVDVPMLRLKMDTMKWHASKLKPKKFGDSVQQTPVNTEIDEDCKKRYQELDEKNRKEY